MKNEWESRMRPKFSTPRTDFGVRLIMARSGLALNPRRGGNHLLAEFVVLTFCTADLRLRTAHASPGLKLLYRTPWTARSRYSPGARSSIRSTLLVSSFSPIGRESCPTRGAA